MDDHDDDDADYDDEDEDDDADDMADRQWAVEDGDDHDDASIEHSDELTRLPPFIICVEPWFINPSLIDP